MYVLASGAALKFMGSFSFESQQFWKLIITILHKSYQEFCAPKSSPKRWRPWWEELNFSLRKKVRIWGLVPAGRSFSPCVLWSQWTVNRTVMPCSKGMVGNNFPEIWRCSPVICPRTWHALGAKLGFVGGTGWINNPDFSQSKWMYLEPSLWLCSPVCQKGHVKTRFLVVYMNFSYFCIREVFSVLLWWKACLYLTSCPAGSFWSQHQVASWVRGEYCYLKRKGYTGRSKIPVL